MNSEPQKPKRVVAYVEYGVGRAFESISCVMVLPLRPEQEKARDKGYR